MNPIWKCMELYGSHWYRYPRIMNMIYIYIYISGSVYVLCHRRHPKIQLVSNMCLPLFNDELCLFRFSRAYIATCISGQTPMFPRIGCRKRFQETLMITEKARVVSCKFALWHPSANPINLRFYNMKSPWKIQHTLFLRTDSKQDIIPSGKLT